MTVQVVGAREYTSESEPEDVRHGNYYPGQKKEPSLRFAARRTLFHVWHHARSAQGKSRGQSRIGLALRWSRLIEHDITRGRAFFSPRISMMVLFFVQGSMLKCEWWCCHQPECLLFSFRYLYWLALGTHCHSHSSFLPQVPNTAYCDMYY